MSVSDSEGKKPVVPLRLLPLGIMPHGASAVKMIEKRNIAYRDGNRPPWDMTDRPASQLVRAVVVGTVRPGKALVLGCGGGANAMYLAQKGFKVTAVDVSPTAMALVQAKVYKVRAGVRLVLADVLALPDLGQFDFVFYSGSYHGVRRVDAKGFVAATAAMCKPGGRFMILTGKADKTSQDGSAGVKEKDIRDAFASTFDVESLATTHIDRPPTGGIGAPAWSVMLRRKSPATKP